MLLVGYQPVINVSSAMPKGFPMEPFGRSGVSGGHREKLADHKSHRKSRN